MLDLPPIARIRRMLCLFFGQLNSCSELQSSQTTIQFLRRHISKENPTPKTEKIDGSGMPVVIGTPGFVS